jgi:uncharacterized protein (DUF2252 family)
MSESKRSLPNPEDRTAVLKLIQSRKMARSPHAYVRGNTSQFYEWITGEDSVQIPQGPPVWIGGDCHVGNLGPLGDRKERVRVQIRDLDQTVIGNPSHDLIRLALSLASSARGANLPGVTTARMLEAIMDGYESAFDHDFDETEGQPTQPESVKVVMERAAKRTWKHLAKERIEDTRPKIPLGKRFWPISRQESDAIDGLLDDSSLVQLATMIRSRDNDAQVEIVDAAYWVKGCSSLGSLRYAVLVNVKDQDAGELCLVDLKEAVDPVAPPHPDSEIPADNAQRVLEGARHVAPFLGDRMLGAAFMGKSIFMRELLPQDLKVEIEQLTTKEAMRAAAFLASVVGFAHARQMDTSTRTSWRSELGSNRSASLDAPSWLWTSVIELLVSHERSYLEHCRRFAMSSFD